MIAKYSEFKFWTDSFFLFTFVAVLLSVNLKFALVSRRQTDIMITEQFVWTLIRSNDVKLNEGLSKAELKHGHRMFLYK